MNGSRYGAWLGMLGLFGTAVRGAELPLNEARSSLEKWVETRQLISKTKSDWQADKDLLDQSVQLLERELAAVADQWSKLGTNNVQVEKERLQADTGLKVAKESLEQTRKFAVELEGQVRQLIPRLPVPLRDQLKSWLVRLPDSSENTKMLPTERVQVAVGILNELDKFNNAVSVFSDKQKNEKGEDQAVETVFIGLGAAYFVNDTGDFAGVGAPGPKGWEWSPRKELAPKIRETIRIYRNEHSAQFITLPVVIQ